MNAQFDGFDVTLIEEDDGEWIAHFIEFPNVSAAGDTACSLKQNHHYRS